MYYLAFYSTPFEQSNGTIDLVSLRSGPVCYPQTDLSNYSAEFIQLIDSLLVPDPSKSFSSPSLPSRRPSAAQLIERACSMQCWRMTQEVSLVLAASQRFQRAQRAPSLRFVRKLQGPPMLSDSDLSSSSEAEELAQQKREAEALLDKQRVALSHYFGDLTNHRRWVAKCTSRIPEPPARRSIKKIAMAASETQSIDFFFRLISKYRGYWGGSPGDCRCFRTRSWR